MAQVLLTVEEVAKRVHMKIDSVRKKIRAGELRAYKPGKRLLIDEKDLELFIKRSQKRAA